MEKSYLVSGTRLAGSHNLIGSIEYDKLITVGEAPFTHDMDALAQYVLPANKELNMVFQFELMDVDSSGMTRDNPLVPRKWRLTELKEIINRWQTFRREEGFWNR